MLNVNIDSRGYVVLKLSDNAVEEELALTDNDESGQEVMTTFFDDQWKIVEIHIHPKYLPPGHH